MRVATGKVIAGKIVVEGAKLEEGSSVTIIASDERETFRLGSKDEAALLSAIAEAKRGDTIDAKDLLAKLARVD